MTRKGMIWQMIVGLIIGAGEGISIMLFISYCGGVDLSFQNLIYNIQHILR
jgi:hypothetical protein